MSAFCTKCGQRLDADVRFCTACGRDVNSAAPAPPPGSDSPSAPSDRSVPPRPASPPPRPSTPPPVVATAPATPPTTPERGRRSWLLAAIAVVVVVGLVGAAVAVLGGGGDDSPTIAGPGDTGDTGDIGDTGASDGGATIDFGTIAPTDVPPAAMVTTEEWGEVPADRINVVLAEGRGEADAEALAAELGGQVLGQVEFMRLFQVSIPPDGEAGLRAALATAAAFEGVAVVDGTAVVFPDQVPVLDVEIPGVPISPLLEDPVYAGQTGRGYEVTGVQRAWDFVRGSGLPLHGVRVGVADDGVWTGNDEFGGDVGYDAIEPSGTRAAPEAGNDSGSHGTGVANLIGADADNGGTAGVASVLGKNLGISTANIFDQPRSFAAVFGDIERMVKGNPPDVPGATIINMSFGCTDCSEASATASRAFFERMATEHPNVLFVASAGNDGKVVDGSKRFPSGLNLPNMITVGNVKNDGTIAGTDSNMSSENYEVTLAAPGDQAVQGVTPDGTIVSNDLGGTSMATPQVAAAAAIMRSLDPTLTPGQIKQILTETARPGVTFDDHSNPIDQRLGAGLLAVDEAVRKVINDVRVREDPDAELLEPEDLVNLGTLDAVAISGEEPGEWTVHATVNGCFPSCTDVTIDVQGQHALFGSTTQHLDAPGDVSWGVSLQDPSTTIVVRRTDNRAGSRILIQDVDLSGSWSGTVQLTGVDAPEDSCLAGAEVPGEVTPMGLVIDAEPGREGLVTITLEEDYTTRMTSSGSTIEFTLSAEGAVLHFTGTATLDPGGGGTIDGTFSGSLFDGTVSGVWSVTRSG